MKTLTKKLIPAVLLAITALTCVIIVACTPEETVKPEGPETGIYYLDLGYDEYTLTLKNGDKFALVMGNEGVDGIYAVDGNRLDMTYSEGTLEAELKNDVITLDYKDEKMTFIKKVYYTVSFDSDGGSAVKSATVVNGKLAAKPDDPVKDGMVFVGWFADSSKTVPFAFNAPVSANTTVYAKWAAKSVGERSYEVGFDLGYEGAEKIEAATTVGGALHVLPKPAERSGYVFMGWWYSQTEKADELTYKVDENTVFNESTTLFAVWQNEASEKLASPAVSVSGGAVTWDAVTGGLLYYVIDIVAPNGRKVDGFDNKRNNGTTNEIVDFASMAEGVYKVSVTAISSDSSKNSETAVRYYTNKGLARVSLFEVAEPSLLLFNEIENAQEYYITVECGNERHKHKMLYNGKSTNYDFSGCVMKEGGIQITVTAKADGYAPSVSKAYIIDRTLGDMGALSFNAATETVTWDSVPFAYEYMVSVNGGEEFSVGASTSACIKNYAAVEGKVSVKVYAKTVGYNSSKPAESEFSKTKLAAPTGLTLEEGMLGWNPVAGASSYEVKIGNGEPFTVASGTSVDITEKLSSLGLGDFEIAVRAVGTDSSLWSDGYQITTKNMATGLKYSNGIFSWKPVMNISYYRVRINGRSQYVYDAFATSIPVTLTEGVNTFSVTVYDEDDNPSREAEITVNGYVITFLNNYGTGVPPVYVAVGDTVNLPTARRTNHDFYGWYDVPGGAAANGKQYTNTVFAGSGSLTLYADFIPSKFDVHFDVAEDLGGVLSKELEAGAKVTYMENYKFPVPETTDGTKQFGGWYPLPNGGGTAYTDAYGNSLSVWSIGAADNTVYAFWQDEILSYELMDVAGYSSKVYAVKAGAKFDTRSEITIPSTYKGLPVGMIAPSAFENASRLKVLNIPDTLLLVSEADPFPDDLNNKDFRAINVYHVEGNNRIRYQSVDGVLIDNGSIDAQVAGTAVPEIKYAPQGISGTFEIPDGIQVIYTMTFEDCGIEEIIIPASVIRIEGNAFFDCDNLTSVIFLAPGIGENELPLTLEPRAFNGPDLEEIKLPKRTASISLNTYGGAQLSFDSDVKVTIENGGKYYSTENGVIYNADKTCLIYVPYDMDVDELTVPNGVATIESGAFSKSDLETVKLPNTATNIKEGAFYGTNVRNVVFMGNSFAGSVTIGKKAFANARYLTSVTFEEHNQVSVIGESAFEGCGEYFKEIVLPAALETVGDAAFRNCKGLKTVSFASGESSQYKNLSFGHEVFRGCSNLESFTISSNMVDLPDFGGCDKLADINVPDDNLNLSGENGVIYNKQKTELYYYPRGKQDETFVVPDTVEVIRYSVFEGNKYIKNVVIGANVKSIGAYAFNNCTGLGGITFNGTGDIEILQYAFHNTGFVTLSLPGTVKSIGDYAFAEMRELATLTLGEGIETIGEFAFASNHMLEGGASGLVIPRSVTVLGDSAFALSEKLINVKFADNAKVETIGEYAFWGTKITSITIPASVTEIGEYAFTDMYLRYGSPAVSENGVLAGLTIEPNSKLTKIGAYAFYGAIFTSVNIPKTVEVISPMAFANCKLLETLTFEAGGTADLTIGAYEYETDEDGDVSSKMGRVFYNTAIKTVNIPARVTEIGDYTFEDCSHLTSVTFEEGGKLKNISNELFLDCSALKSVTNIPNTIVNRDPVGLGEYIYNRAAIGESAFKGCSSLETLTFAAGNENSVTIGPEAFRNCAKLTSVTLYGKLTDYAAYRAYWDVIADDAFYGCNLLAEINIGTENKFYASYDGVVYTSDYKTLVMCPVGVTELTVHNDTTNIAAAAFNNCTYLASLTFPSTLELDVSVFNGLAGLTEITVTGGLGNYSSEGGVLFNGDKTSIVYYPKGLKATSYNVPGSVTKIEYRAFYGNTTLKSVTFAVGADVEIGEYAFAASNIQSVSLPANLVALGDYAFNNCASLTSLTFAEGCKLTEIPHHAIWGCSSLTSLEFPAKIAEIPGAATLTTDFQNMPKEYEDSMFKGCGSLANITFAANSVCETIGNGAFCDLRSSLVRLELPDSVKSIGDNICHTGAGQYSGYSFGKLEYVRMPANVETIGARAFKSARYAQFDNTGFEKLISVGEYAFYQAGTTRRSDYATIGFEVNFANILQSIGAHAFDYSGIKGDLVIPDSVGVIGDYAFNGCKQLTGAHIPASATLGTDIFNYCTALTDVTIADGVRILPKGTFSGCKSITSIEFPASITGFGESCLSGTGIVDFVLPGQVTVIPANFFKDSSETPALKTFTMHQNVSSIGNSAFDGCKNLENIIIDGAEATEGQIVLPVSVNYLGTAAFRNCSKLPNVIVPELITKLPDNVFYGCTSFVNYQIPSHIKELGTGCVAGIHFTTFVLPEKITAVPANMFVNNTEIEKVILHDKVTVIGSGAFSGCTSLSLITVNGDESATVSKLPALVTNVADNLFKGCTSLNAINLTNKITSIGSNAFEGSGLISINIPATVTSISGSAFKGCTSLKTVEFSEFAASEENPSAAKTSLTSIGSSAFEGCSVLNGITLPATLTDIQTSAFKNCTALSSITVPEKVTVINQNVFEGSGLTQITLSSNLTKIDREAFKDCQSLGLVEIPAKVEYIRRGAFSGCINLQTVTFKKAVLLNEYGQEKYDGVESSEVYSIESDAFKGCSKLSSIIIPDFVTTLSMNVFEGCSSLSSVTFGKDLKYINSESFKNCTSLNNLTLTANITTIDRDAFVGCTALTVINSGDNNLYSFEDGAMYNLNKTELKYYISDLSGTVTVREGVDTLGIKLFQGMSQVTAINLPATLKTLNQYVFDGTSITSISIPKGVTAIPSYTFRNCANLGSVTLPDGLLSIESSAFANCTSLKSLKIPSTVNSMDSYDIFEGSSVTNLDFTGNANYAFENGAVYNANKTVIKYILPETSGTFVVNAGVNIGYDEDSLSSNYYLFSETKITIVIIKKGALLGYHALYGMSGKTVKFENTEAEVNALIGTTWNRLCKPSYSWDGIPTIEYGYTGD